MDTGRVILLAGIGCMRNDKQVTQNTVEIGDWLSSPGGANIRFTPAGDLVSTWGTFGGVDMQLTHVGAVPNLAITRKCHNFHDI